MHLRSTKKQKLTEESSELILNSQNGDSSTIEDDYKLKNRLVMSPTLSQGSTDSSNAAGDAAKDTTRKGGRTHQKGGKKRSIENLVDTAGSGSRRRSVRERKAPVRYTVMHDLEEQQMAAAVKNSLISAQVDEEEEEEDLPFVKEFHPSEEEFKHPVDYIESIREEGEKYGIVKIIPPKSWKPPFMVSNNNDRKFTARVQRINELGQGKPFEQKVNEYTFETFKTLAQDMKEKYNYLFIDEEGKPDRSLENTERIYWTLVDKNNDQNVEIEYAADLPTDKYGSGFPSSTAFSHCTPVKKGSSKLTSSTQENVSEFLVDPTKPKMPNVKKESPIKKHEDVMSDLAKVDGLSEEERIKLNKVIEEYQNHPWNLNRFHKNRNSLLQFVPKKYSISGGTIPWLYIGMFYSSFCWHCEDNHLFSINYNHFGGVKTWYSVPSAQIRVFEKFLKTKLRKLFLKHPNLLHQIVTQVSPFEAKKSGVDVYRAHQKPGEFVVTFPKGYHCGFAQDFTVGEAVNFATGSWLDDDLDSLQKMNRGSSKRPLFPHEWILIENIRHLGETDLDLKTLTHIRFHMKETISCEVENRRSIQEDDEDMQTEALDVANADYDHFKCKRCNHLCYLSAILCKSCGCYCIAHTICRCPNGHRKLVSRFSESQLRRFLKKLDEYIASLKDNNRKQK
eukprot:CAMPEP_0114996894 /NCGR_PEP_ID=MMETSP0216-20121206/14584_1 /TAXON_ID=223996 /ORGANISM="Protocruzia adherens, Strain Boccale" /LENGTH=674 /DNA_ID=CAMNT_0002361189 /DNA_START=218 /DNA_END=2242 /DNA_ORIENTATION=-